jgi:5-methylcytosine-specific restriction endonuclease McrA
MSDCSLAHDEGCQACGTPLTGRQTRWCSRKCARSYTENHRWTQARAKAKRDAAMWLCASCGWATDQVEVNHVVPCLGKHGTWGCHHHQDNLEVLCIPCHRAKTKQQREEGLI